MRKINSSRSRPIVALLLAEIKRLLTSKEAQGLYGHFRQRLLDLVESAEPMGWGYGDDVRDTVAALERRHAGE